MGGSSLVVMLCDYRLVQLLKMKMKRLQVATCYQVCCGKTQPLSTVNSKGREGEKIGTFFLCIFWDIVYREKLMDTLRVLVWEKILEIFYKKKKVINYFDIFLFIHFFLEDFDGFLYFPWKWY